MEDEIRPNGGGFGEKTVRDEELTLNADSAGDFDPDERAAANASKEQMRAEALAVIAGADSFILATLGRDINDDETVDLPEDMEFAFAVQFTGVLDGEVRESTELLWHSYSHVIDRLAAITEVPRSLAFTYLMQRWISEHTATPE